MQCRRDFLPLLLAQNRSQVNPLSTSQTIDVRPRVGRLLVQRPLLNYSFYTNLPFWKNVLV